MKFISQILDKVYHVVVLLLSTVIKLNIHINICIQNIRLNHLLLNNVCTVN